MTETQCLMDGLHHIIPNERALQSKVTGSEQLKDNNGDSDYLSYHVITKRQIYLCDIIM